MMRPSRSGFVALGVLALAALAPTLAAAGIQTPDSNGLLDVETLASRIDHFLAVRQREKGVQPAPLTDDAAFIRRVYLDLAGCIPPLTDVRDFLDDTRPDKRRRWVDMLLDSKKPSRKPNAFRQHFANVWRAAILASVANNDKAAGVVTAMETWLQERLKENTPYDRLVRQMITASNEPSRFFYQVNESKVENLAASTSRLFLGVKLECAQCHEDRSGGSWTQSQFWSFAAFFASNRELPIPGKKKKTVQARFLGGAEPSWKSGDNPQAVLVDWLVSVENPYFARAAVNRLWGYLFGTGLVDPVDEQGEHNPPSHPELLDELARQFAGHGFDLKYLIRVLVASQAYQRSSLVGPGVLDKEPRLFGRMAVRGLSAEQLFDSLAEAAEYPDNFRAQGRQQFVSRFGHRDKPTEVSTSILQALHLMNGPLVANRTSPELNATLGVLAGQATSPARCVESLFLMVLSRKPTLSESERIVAYLARGGVDRREALADVFWTLLNSPEFSVNY
jgi:Protein of unknown function (DUF1553)/Protein of unknown function (DUF1549)